MFLGKKKKIEEGKLASFLLCSYFSAPADLCFINDHNALTFLKLQWENGRFYYIFSIFTFYVVL